MSFNRTSVINSLYGIVGLKQPYNPNFAILDTDNQTSRSGYFVSDLPYVKIEWIKDTQNYSEISDIDFNEYLKRLQESAISNVCNQVFNQPSYIDRQVLYKNANNNVDPVDLGEGLIGHKIEISSDKNLAFEISRVFLDFDGTGNIELYLFSSWQRNFLFKETVAITDTHQEVTLNWKVNNEGGIYKGDYYLVYRNLNTTIPLPFKRNYNNSSVRSQITNMKVCPIQFKGYTDETLPDLTTEDGITDNVGINPDITVYDDYTDLIIQNQNLFGKAIQLQMGLDILTEYSSTLRSNKNERRSRELTSKIADMIDNIDSDGNHIGMRSKLFGEVVGLRKEIKKLEGGYFADGLITHTLY
jgi:DNA/RNA endonuclease YhcR with UshA esterase domain